LNSRLELTNIADRRCAVSFSYQLRDATVAGDIGLLATVVATMFCLAEEFIAFEVVDVRI